MTLPQNPTAVAPVPHGRTAQRLDWLLLPPMVRRFIEGKLGSPVADADSAGSGYTPGFASVLTGENGERMFVKAASKKAQRVFAESYREEVRKLSRLPGDLPIPKLLWSHEDDLWMILGLEYVDGPNPTRPWKRTELDACLDSLEQLADALDTPAAGDAARQLRRRVRRVPGRLGPRAKGRTRNGRTSRMRRRWPDGSRRSPPGTRWCTPTRATTTS